MSSSSTTAPDGGVTSYEFNPVSYRDGPGVAGGLVQKVTRPDGSQVGTHWSSKAPPNIQSGLGPRSNHYVAWEHETAVGSPNLIRTRRFEVDQNGNRFGEHERSWAAWGGTPPTDWTQYGNLMRSTVTALQTPGPPIGTTTIEQSVYIASTAPRILGLPASITVNNGTAAPADEKREFGYYSPQTGNVQTLRKLDRRPGDTDGVWREWSFEYENSNQGRIAKATDPDGKWTAWTYSGFNLASKSVPDVGMTTYAFDPDLALLTSQQLPNGRTDTFTYDSLGRLLTSNQGGQSLRRYAYDDQARWIVERSDVELPGDQRSASVYYEDGLGRERLRRTLEAKPASDVAAANEGGGGIRVETVYEVNTTRNAVKVSNPYRTGQTEARGWTVTLRDAMGRTCAVENYSGADEPVSGSCGAAGAGHGGRTAMVYGTYSYPGVGHWTADQVTEAGSPQRQTTRGYNALGQMVAVLEGGVLTSYTYDSAARLTGVNQAGRTRSFSYSTAGWLVSATNPESGTITYDYTGAGRLLKRTDARGVTFCQGVLSGPTCTPSFNGAGKPLAASYSDGTPGVSYTYEYGRLKTVTNSAAATSYDYDTLDRVTARRETVDGKQYAFSAAWSPAGLKSETYPSGRVVTHTYNDAGQILNLSGQTSTGQRNYVTNAAWAAHGASKTLPLGNGVSETWQWNYRLQPTGVTAGAFSLGYKYCSDGSDTCGTNNGNLMQQTIGHANVTQSYTYDAFGRIADARERVTGGPTDAWVRTYGYDTWGNRWVAAGSGPYMDPFTALGASNFNAQNQLVLGTAQYDPAGNQTRMGDYTFSYDAENRLKTSTINGSTVTHYYDGEGRRVKRVGPGTRTIVYAYGMDGELAAEYDTEPSTVPGGVQYVAVDHLGSTRAVMNGAGAITRLEDFLPFGETITAGIAGRGALYPATEGAEVAGASKRFTGKEREGEVGAGLDYFGARYFSGAQGRFTTPDLPFADQHPDAPQSWNIYAYARNNPLAFIDDGGRQTRKPVPGALGYTYRGDLTNPHDNPNFHIFNRKGIEIGRISVQEGFTGRVLESGNRETALRMITEEYAGYTVPNAVREGIEGVVQQRGIHPRFAVGGGPFRGFAIRGMGALSLLSVLTGAIADYKQAQATGVFTNIFGENKILDPAKAAASLGAGTIIQYTDKSGTSQFYTVSNGQFVRGGCDRKKENCGISKPSEGSFKLVDLQ